MTGIIKETNVSIESYKKVKEEIDSEVKAAEAKLGTMITSAIDKLLPEIVTEKVNSLAGTQWNEMVKGIESLADVTKSVRSIEDNIATLLETMNKYKGLVELSNDCKLMLKYKEVTF